MKKNPKNLEDLIAIETSWDSNNDSVCDEQSVCYSKDKTMVTSINERVKECAIPYGVKVICDNATGIDYSEGPELVNITLPDSLVAIGEKAFYLQQILEDFKMPKSVEIVKRGAFIDARIEKLSPDNSIKYFGDSSFATFYLNGELIIKSAIHIGDSAFAFAKITSVKFSEKLERIGICAFCGCEKLQSITIPKTVTEIGGGALSGCIELEKIELLCSGYIIEDGALYNSDKTELISIINRVGKFKVPYGVKKICNGAFNCSKITAITIPRTVKEIGKYAFNNTQLKSVSIPNSVKKIGQAAFKECTNLKKVKLPKELKVIEDKMFEDCDELLYIKMPETLTHIGDSAFYGCSEIEEIILPETVVEIGKDAFKYCDNLQDVNIPPKVTHIAENTFYHTQIYNVEIPDSVKTIADGAFGCCELEYVELPSSLESLSESAFTPNYNDFELVYRK